MSLSLALKVVLVGDMPTVNHTQ